MEQSYEIEPGLHVLPAFVSVPTIGLLPANAFLVNGEQPYLVDTGLLADGEAFIEALEGILDLAQLRWIYLTHTDPDHVGALVSLLERAPRARVITTFIGIAKLQLSLRAVPPHRVLLRNPGERIELGDRTLTVMRPPLLDAPETTIVHDSRLDALFSADAFGGPLEQPVALANELSAKHLEASEVLWATADAPWIHLVGRARFAELLAEIRDLDPAWVLSAHLPPARRLAGTLCQNLAKALDAAPFAAPDQAAFETIIREAASAPQH